jgi:hypothetical protein
MGRSDFSQAAPHSGRALLAAAAKAIKATSVKAVKAASIKQVVHEDEAVEGDVIVEEEAEEEGADEVPDITTVVVESEEGADAVPDITRSPATPAPAAAPAPDRGVVAAAVLEEAEVDVEAEALLGSDGKPLAGCLPAPLQHLVMEGNLEALDTLKSMIESQSPEGG